MIFHRSWQTLALVTGLLVVPACGGGGGGGGSTPTPDTAQSTFRSSVPFGASADGASLVTLEAIVLDRKGRALSGLPVEFRADGYGTALTQPGLTDVDGRVLGAVSSTAAEAKSITAIVSPGEPSEIDLGTITVTFIEPLEDAFYVSPSGSDANSGRTPAEPWQTLQFAIDQLAAGETLIVAPGTYAPATITVSGTQNDPIVLRGDVDGTFTGQAGPVVIDAGGTSFGLLFQSATDVTVRGFEVTNAFPIGTELSAGIAFDASLNERVTLLDCSIHGCQRGLDVRSARGLLVENSRISNNLGDGVVLGLAGGSIFLHNLVYGNGGVGLALEGESLGLLIGLNTFFRNDGDHFAERVSGSTGTLSYNVLSEGGGDALDFGSASLLSPTFNLSWANAGFEVQLTVPDPDGIVADPLFADPFGDDGVLGGTGAADDDFRLLGGSAAFDAGDVNAADLSLLRSGPMARYSSRVDGVADGESPDGDELNLGFHYPVALDAYASSDADGGRLAYALPEGVTLRSISSDAAGSFADPVRAQAINQNIQWVVHEVVPNSPVEYTAVLADTGTRTELVTRRWNGRRWSDDDASPIVHTIPSANAGERGFDLELEDVSGDALLVYSNDDQNPLFRTCQGGRWSDSAPVFPSAIGTGSVLWVELRRQTGTNRVALVALDDAQNLIAAVWDGSAWGNHELLATQVVETRDYRAFDLAWESLSGELLVVWGFSVFAEQARFATLAPGGAWQFGLHPSSEAIGAQVELSADPTTDRIAAVFGEADLDDDVTVSIWNGSTFVDTAEVALQGVFGQYSLQVGWFGTTGVAYALWRDAGQSGAFVSAHFRAGWKIEEETSFPGVGAVIRAESDRGAGDEAATLTFLDANGSLYSMQGTWNGTGIDWALLNGGLPVANGLDMMQTTQPFSFDKR